MGLAGECVAGLWLGALVALWSAGLTICASVWALGAHSRLVSLVHWANFTFGWPCPALGLSSLLLLDFLRCLATLFLLQRLHRLFYRFGLTWAWLDRVITLCYHLCYKMERHYCTSAALVASLVRLCWVWEPEALERLEVPDTRLSPGPPLPLDPATDDSFCTALRDLRRMAAADESLARTLAGSSCPMMERLAKALRPGLWDAVRGRLGGLLPDLRTALLQRPSPASVRLRCLLIGLSGDQCRLPNGQRSPEAARVNQMALHIVCDEDEDAAVVEAAWEMLMEWSEDAEWTSFALKLLCENPQRPKRRMGRIFERGVVLAADWFPDGQKGPLAGLATQARLGLHWAAEELCWVMNSVHDSVGSLDRRAAFRAVGGFGSLAPALLHGLRHCASDAERLFLILPLTYILLFLRSSGTRPEDRVTAVGEWAGAGLVPLLRDRAGQSETWPWLARRARDLLPFLVGPPQRLPAALLITSQAQAEDDAYFARCRRPRIPLKLNPNL